MADKVSVRRHVRKRTGRTAQLAASLGLPETVTVRDFSRRRPSSHRQHAYMGGKWAQKMPGNWRREYATGVYGDISSVSAGGMRAYEVLVSYDRPGRDELIVETTTGDSLEDAEKLADRAFQKWFLKRELKARSEAGLLFERDYLPMMFDTDTDDMLLADLDVPPEMKIELKSYMGTLKRTRPPRRG